MKKAGLIDCHAYTLINCCEVTLDDGVTTERLCLIRNPWGRHEWNGKWSDSSPEWTESVIAQVPFYQNKNDGCFWICYDDYLEFFYITTICYYLDDYVDETVPDQHPQAWQLGVKRGNCFGACRFDVEEDMNNTSNICIDQIDSRFVDKDMSGNYEYGQIIAMLAKVIYKDV